MLQFNYWNPDTIKARIQDLMKVAELADGVRCDVAMLGLDKEFDDMWGSIVRLCTTI